MTAVREELLAAIDSALSAIAGVAYEAEPTGDPDTLPALALYDLGQSNLETPCEADRDELELLIEGQIAGSGAAARAAASELHAEVIRRLYADETFGGLAELVIKGDLEMFATTLASKPVRVFNQRINIQFTHRRGDPSLAA